MNWRPTWLSQGLAGCRPGGNARARAIRKRELGLVYRDQFYQTINFGRKQDHINFGGKPKLYREARKKLPLFEIQDKTNAP